MQCSLPSTPKKILIIKPSSLGDIIHSLPFLHCLRQGFPGAEIHWVVARGLHRVLENNPCIDRLWIIDKDKWKRLSRLSGTIRELEKLYKGLRRQKFDLSIDLSGLLRSGLITWAAAARCKYGLAEGDEGSTLFYTHKVKGGMDNHAIDRYLAIATALGCDISEIEYPLAPLPEVPAVCTALPKEYAVIAPSAGKEANRWPARRFGELAARLPLASVVISSQADAAIAKEVVACSRGKAVSLAGKTGLMELFAVINQAKFFISNDTGPMHIAAACKVPVFAIFGPANPARTGPYGPIHTIIREDLPCSPCYAWKPCKHWQCMQDLSVDKVWRIIERRRGE